MTLESTLARRDNPARDKDAQVLATLGYYLAFSEYGPPPEVRHMDGYEWDSEETGKIAVLPDMRVLSKAQIDRMKRFVEKGNTLLISGLSGFYDESSHAYTVHMPGAPNQPLAELTGAKLREVFLTLSPSEIQLDETGLQAPVQLWKSTL